DDTNGRGDFFVHDRDTDGDGVFDQAGHVSTVRVSVKADGSQSTVGGPSPNGGTSVSNSGRYVSFHVFGSATDLVSAPNCSIFCMWQPYVHDRDADGNGIF